MIFGIVYSTPRKRSNRFFHSFTWLLFWLLKEIICCMNNWIGHVLRWFRLVCTRKAPGNIVWIHVKVLLYFLSLGRHFLTKVIIYTNYFRSQAVYTLDQFRHKKKGRAVFHLTSCHMICANLIKAAILIWTLWTSVNAFRSTWC